MRRELLMLINDEASMNDKTEDDGDFIIWALLNQAKDTLFKVRGNELNQYGISATESQVLFTIQDLGGRTTPAAISRRVYREHNTVTALLSRMEKKGLVMKVKDSERKNIWRVDMTEKGKDVYRQSAKMESIHTAISILSDKEVKQLGTYLRKIRDNALKQLTKESVISFP
jgi:DNA-binding MarR family transcriptional regulator